MNIPFLSWFCHLVSIETGPRNKVVVGYSNRSTMDWNTTSSIKKLVFAWGLILELELEARRAIFCSLTVGGYPSTVSEFLCICICMPFTYTDWKLCIAQELGLVKSKKKPLVVRKPRKGVEIIETEELR